MTPYPAVTNTAPRLTAISTQQGARPQSQTLADRSHENMPTTIVDRDDDRARGAGAAPPPSGRDDDQTKKKG